MSSEQMRRENVSDERNIEVEKDRVPKMTTHFESLAREHKDDIPVRVAGFEYHSGEPQSESEMKRSEDQAEKMGSQMRFGREQEEEDKSKKQGPSLEEISNMRATAQQQSMEAIRAAEDRYNKAKEVGILQKPEESNKDTTMEKGQQAKEGKDVISSKGGALIEKTKQAKDYTAEKATEGKDVISSKGGALMEKTKQAKDYTAQKAVEAKDVISSQGQSAAQYAAEKGKVAAGYVENKAVAAKDVTVETGKTVASQAAVAGWGAAHYTLEKVAEATKAVAGVTSGVAGYAKDAVVSAEEKAAEYAARKRTEAKEGLIVHKSSSHDKDETLVSKEQHETTEVVPSEKTEQSFEQGGEGGGVLHAIGETIVEIGQTTTELLAGQKHPKRDEAIGTGTGEGV